jgi:DNA mismatch repair ATPase MutS
VERETCEVFTPGTLVHSDMLGTSKDANYLVVLRQENAEEYKKAETGAGGGSDGVTAEELESGKTAIYGICILDVTTCEFMLGEIPLGVDY